MSKKAVFITIHVGANFGSVLQTVATSYVLRQLGVEAEVLDYRPPRVLYKRLFKKAFNGYFAPIRLMVWMLMKVYNDHIYLGFVKRNCKLTPTFYSMNEVKGHLPEADYYVSGSDQVWNSTHNEGIDPMYYFPYVPDDKTIFAYSSSFGKENLPKEEIKVITPWLKRFRAISVREESARQLLSRMGIENAVHLLDPTLMLNRETWKSLYITKWVVDKPYILVFLPYNTVSKDLVYQTARKIAQLKRLEVVTFSWEIFSEKLADRTIKYAKPEDFLSLFYYADVVVTNSFHGTAFAINMNRQMWVYEPSAFPTRLLSLIHLVGLDDRVLSDVITDEQIGKTIDYETVNLVLDVEREKTLDFLGKVLN